MAKAPQNFDIRFKEFATLSVKELYEIIYLRQEVFIVEQDCPYLDADHKDILCHHLSIYEAEVLVAYARVVPPGVSYQNYSSIGRVVNKKSARGKGIGKILMKEAIKRCLDLYPTYHIKISAQQYLDKFYKSLCFVPNGDFYLEDNIPHQAMLLEQKN